MDKNLRGLILLLSLVLVAIPLFIFPSRLGLPLSSGSTINMLYEIVYYSFILYWFRRDTSLIALVVGAALTLIYRMVLGAVFGLAVAAFYGIEMSVALSLGMTRYLPAILLHAAVAPFLTRSLYLSVTDGFAPERPSRRKVSVTNDTRAEVIKSQKPANRLDGLTALTDPAPENHHESSYSSHYSHDDNQFEKAVAYLGESGTVRLAMIVDDEGLPLACHNRSGEDIDLWAPFSILMEQQNQTLFRRFRQSEKVDRLDVGTRQLRIIMRRIERVILVIMADNTVDETIHIRIAQATDMVKRYMKERYSPSMFARAEESYVSDS